MGTNPGIYDENNYKINCCIGTEGIENDKYYNLDIVGDVWLMNDITNYNKGLITVKDDGDSKTRFVLQNDVEKELHVPVNVESGELHVNSNTNIYSEVNISSKASVHFFEKKCSREWWNY